jgi:HSP20 family protein
MRAAPLGSPFQWDPWREIEELRRALERVGEPPVGRGLTAGAVLDFIPPADLYDAGEAFVVMVDLPGMKDGEVAITTEGRTITIRGQRGAEHPGDEGCLCCERPVGRFARTVELPENIDTDHINAVLKRGVLVVTLPKGKAAAPRGVTVRPGAED